MLTLSSSIVVHIKGSEHSFVFFLPRVETDKRLHKLEEWMDTSCFSKGFSNDYPTELSISGNGLTSLIWSFSTTLYALALFSNVSQILAYIRSWRSWRILTILCYFNFANTLSNQIAHKHLGFLFCLLYVRNLRSLKEFVQIVVVYTINC